MNSALTIQKCHSNGNQKLSIKFSTENIQMIPIRLTQKFLFFPFYAESIMHTYRTQFPIFCGFISSQFTFFCWGYLERFFKPIRLVFIFFLFLNLFNFPQTVTHIGSEFKLDAIDRMIHEQLSKANGEDWEKFQRATLPDLFSLFGVFLVIVMDFFSSLS